MPHIEGAEPVGKAGHGDDGRQVRVRYDEANAFRGESGVERHIGGVDFHHRQQRDIGFDGFIEQQADAVAGSDPPVEQMPRDPIGALVEFPIAEDGVSGIDRGVASETLAGMFK